MSYIVVSRINGKGYVVVLQNADDEAAEFSTYVEAEAAAEKITAYRTWGFQVLEVEDG